MKKCKDCGEEFEPTKAALKNGRKDCGSCHRAKVYAAREAFRQENPEEYLDRTFAHKLWTNYRLRREDYDLILAKQGGACAICGLTSSGTVDDRTGKLRRLAIDHDRSCCPGLRSCGQCIRGLLCSGCNTGLGALRDDPALLKRAAEYVLAPRNQI